MIVATSLNRKYLLYTCVMLTSLCRNNATEHIDACLLNSELENQDIDFLTDALKEYDASVIGVKIPGERINKALPVNSQWPLEIYYRLLFPEIFPFESDRFLYLDVDIIVNKDISELYHCDLEQYNVMAAADCNGNSFMERLNDKSREMMAPLIENNHVYFNSGVLLFNLKRMKDYTFNTYLKAMDKWNYSMMAPDQDILNYVHAGHVGYFPWEKYNLFTKHAHQNGITYEDVKDNVAIAHFAGDKPWMTTSVHYDIEQLWWDYAAMIPADAYHKLLKDFQYSTINNPELERSVSQLIADNHKMVEITKKLLESVQV